MTNNVTVNMSTIHCIRKICNGIFFCFGIHITDAQK